MSEVLTNDTRQEANAALMEVEKGLRSSRVGDQCEAIVKFPSLVNRFPFPILINAAYLKLAEVYRTSINFLRLNILKVFQETKKHLIKITSVDEFLRRIFSVIHSNDPIARAVTLRVFGSIASIVADKKTVHHSIHHGLESTDQVEASAAIYATHCFCEHSAIFASGVYDKIASMIQGLTTPVEKKLDLIPILEIMHHDIETATRVRHLCIHLLPSHPSFSLVSALLQTLTTLTLHTLVDSTDQVKLLLYYAQGDGRKVVRQKALSELNRLSLKVHHIWSKDMIQGLYLVVDRANRDKERSSGLHTLYVLSSSIAVHNMGFLQDKMLSFIYSQSTSIAIYSIGVITNVTIAMHKKGLSDSSEMIDLAKMVTEVLLLTQFKENHLFKVILSSLVKLASAHNDVSPLVLDCLLSLLPLLKGSHASMVCRTLVSITAFAQSAWVYVAPKLMDYLDNAANTQHVLVPVTSVLVQLFERECSQFAREELVSTVLPKLFSHLWSLTHSSQLWLAFKIARKASMLGIHEISLPIYSKLAKVVTTVTYRNWLKALCQFSEAQSLILSAAKQCTCSSDVIPPLCQSSAMVHSVIMLLKASSPPTSFGVQFLSVYALWLSTHCQLLTICVSISTAPPPSTDLSRGTEKKFQQCMSQFQSLSQQYESLYSTLFDADPATLEYVTLLQQSCVLMVSIISSVACSRRSLVSPGKPSTPSSGSIPILTPVEVPDNFNVKYLLGQTCRNVYQKVQIAGDSIQTLSVENEASTLLCECSQMLLSVPLCLPQYFFVSLQQTTVKMALSPPLPATGQHVTLFVDTNLTLKVEGVIEHAGQKKMYRSLRAVHVSVKPELERKPEMDRLVTQKAPDIKTLQYTEPVDNDYFQTKFVLALPVPGYYSVHIEASLVDNDGTVWHTGQKEILPVLVNTQDNV